MNSQGLDKTGASFKKSMSNEIWQKKYKLVLSSAKAAMLKEPIKYSTPTCFTKKIKIAINRTEKKKSQISEGQAFKRPLISPIENRLKIAKFLIQKEKFQEQDLGNDLSIPEYSKYLNQISKLKSKYSRNVQRADEIQYKLSQLATLTDL